MALIERLMKTELVTAESGESVRDVAARMNHNGVGAVLVVDSEVEREKDGEKDALRLRGLFSERDLLQRVVVPGLDPGETAVGTVMTADPVAVGPETHVRDCAELIRERGFRHLPVVEDGRPVGILSARDFQTHVVAGLESFIDDDRYREALADGRDPYDHIGGSYEP